MSKIICFNLLNVYPHMQKHIFCWKSTPYFITKSPTFRGWRKEVLGSQKAYSSHIVKQGNKPMPANTHQWVPHGLKSGQVQPSTLLPPGFWSFCSYTCPPTENPTSWHTTQEYYLRSYWLELSGNFWVIFLKKGKHPNITEKKNKTKPKKHKKPPTLIFCSVIWICAKLEGTTCKFFKSGQNICLKFAVTQLSARKTWCWQHNSSIYCLWPKSSHRVTFHSTRLSSRRGYLWSEWNTTQLPRINVLELLRTWQLDFSSSRLIMGLSQRLWTKKKKCFLEKAQFRKCQITGTSFFMMNQHSFVFKDGISTNLKHLTL